MCQDLTAGKRECSGLITNYIPSSQKPRMMGLSVIQILLLPHYCSICSSRNVTVFIFWSSMISDFSSLQRGLALESDSNICISPRLRVHLNDSGNLSIQKQNQ